MDIIPTQSYYKGTLANLFKNDGEVNWTVAYLMKKIKGNKQLFTYPEGKISVGKESFSALEPGKKTSSRLQQACFATLKNVCMVFQQFNLFPHLTVMENVLSGRLGYVSLWRAYRRKYPEPDVAAAFDLVLCPCIADGKVRDIEKMEDGEIDVCFFNGGFHILDHRFG